MCAAATNSGGGGKERFSWRTLVMGASADEDMIGIRGVWRRIEHG
jgi:hypothetical protein